MCRTIVVTSGKGGVGKTTICANLGIILASKNKNVLLVDFDFGLNNLDVVMGVENHITYDIFDVIDGNCTIKQALVQDIIYPKLFMLPSSHLVENNNIDVEVLKNMINELKYMFDYILIDCPAGIDNNFKRAISCADEAIIVTTPHISAIRDADKVLSLLLKYKLNNVCLVLNKVRGDLIVKEKMLSVKDVEDALKLKVIGVIPEEDFVNFSLLSGGGVDSKSDCYKSFSLISEYYLLGKRDIFDPTVKYKGVLGKLKINLRKFV